MAVQTNPPLSGKAALVTGGSRSIGAAIARKLATDGAAVAITYNASPDKAKQVVGDIEAADGKALAIQADAGDAEAVRKTVQAFGGIDIGRYSEGADIAAVVASLACPAASFVTGAEVMADGGLSA